MARFDSKSEFDVIGAGPVGTGRILPGEDVRAQVDTRADGVAVQNTDHLAALRWFDQLLHPDEGDQPTLAWTYADRELILSVSSLTFRSAYDDVANDVTEACTYVLGTGTYDFADTTTVVLVYDDGFSPGDTVNITSASIGTLLREFSSIDAAVTFLRDEAGTGTEKTHYAFPLLLVEAQDAVVLSRYRVPDGNSLVNMRYLNDRVSTVDLSDLEKTVNQDRNLFFLRGTDDLVVDAPAAGSIRVTSSTAADTLYLPNGTIVRIDWSGGPTMTAADPYLAIDLGRDESSGTTITRAPYATDGVYDPAGTDTFLVIASRETGGTPNGVKFITGGWLPVGGIGTWLSTFDTSRVKARFAHIRSVVVEPSDLPSWDPSADDEVQISETVNNDDVDPASNNTIIPFLASDGSWRSENQGILLHTVGVASVYGEEELTFASPTNPDETVDGVEFKTSNGGGGNFGGLSAERGRFDEIYLLNSGPGTYFKLAESHISLGGRVTTLEFEMNAAESDISTNAGDISTNAGNISTNSSNITANGNDIDTLEQDSARLVDDPPDVPTSGGALRFLFDKSHQPGQPVTGSGGGFSAPSANIDVRHIRSTGRYLYYALTDSSGPSSDLVARDFDFTNARDVSLSNEILDVLPVFDRGSVIVLAIEDVGAGHTIKTYEDSGSALSLLDTETPGQEVERLTFVQTSFTEGYVFATTEADDVYYATLEVTLVGGVTWGSWVPFGAINSIYTNIGNIAAVQGGSTGSGDNELSGTVAVWGTSDTDEMTFAAVELESIATGPLSTFNWFQTVSVGSIAATAPRCFCTDGRFFYALISNNTNTEGVLYKIAPRTWEGAGSNADRFDDTVIFAKKVPTGRTFRSLVATGKEVIVATDDELYAWDSDTGAPTWAYFFESGATGSPARTVAELSIDARGFLVGARDNGGGGDALRRHLDGYPGRWLSDIGESNGAPNGRVRYDLIGLYSVPF